MSARAGQLPFITLKWYNSRLQMVVWEMTEKKKEPL